MRPRGWGCRQEELARAVVADILTAPDEDFQKAAADVVRKFEELYRRLALMRYLTLGEVVELDRLVLTATGGAPAIRDLGALESAIDEQERLMLDLASGRLSRAELTGWLGQHVSRPPDQAV